MYNAIFSFNHSLKKLKNQQNLRVTQMLGQVTIHKAEKFELKLWLPAIYSYTAIMQLQTVYIYIIRNLANLVTVI